MVRDAQKPVSPRAPCREEAGGREGQARSASVGTGLPPVCQGKLLRFSSSALDSRKRTRSNMDNGREREEASSFDRPTPPPAFPATNSFEKGRRAAKQEKRLLGYLREKINFVAK